jgi:hypothetical protein
MIDLRSNMQRSTNQKCPRVQRQRPGGGRMRANGKPGQKQFIEKYVLVFIAILGCEDKRIQALSSKKIAVGR